MANRALQQFDPDFQTPLIFDESVDFSDPEESRFAGAFSDGLLAKSDPTLSMSGFQKSGLGDFNDPLRALNGDVYAPYTQPPYVTQAFPPLEDQPSPDTESLQYLPTQNYAGSISFEDQGSPGLEPPSHPAPEVTSYAPQRGSEGSKIAVHVRSQYDLESARAAFLSFGSKQCECTRSLVGYQDSTFNYVFSTEVPSFITTMSQSFAVPLQLVIDFQSDNGPVILQVGVFTYDQFPQAPSDDCRKRRVSSASENIGSRPIKRHSAQEIEAKGERGSYTLHERSASYSPFLPTPTTVSAYPAQYTQERSPRASFDLFAGTSSGSQTSLQAPSPLPTASWSPSFSAAHTLPSTAAPHQQMPAAPARPPNPTLIRTSTMQQSNHLGQAQPFNPYAMYPTKAVLKLNGDLDSMSENWTPEEKEAKRRLVQFTRVQEGSTIHADFKPVSPEDRAPNSICISCIYWEGKDECFVTSVDTIYLLESLVGVRFTVEEKNRIRRNLEGFRPLTVSKAKADSEEFFKVIMGFPAPKPRNIEKDVKVFPWKILSHALKKIIGKYSASYSSTAGALPSSLNGSISKTGAGSDVGTESQRASSPQSLPDSTTSSAYTANLTSTAFSPPVLQSKPALSSCVTCPELAATMAGVSHVYASMPATYSYEPSCQLNQPMLTTGPSWDFGTLADTHPGTAMPSSHPENFDYLSTIPYSMGPTPGV